METKIYDKETGSTIYMEGTFANLTARIEDEDGDTVFEFKNGHLLEFNKIAQNLGNMNNECEEYETEPETDGKSPVYQTGKEQVLFEGKTVEVLEEIDDGTDVLHEGTVTDDITLMSSGSLLVDMTIVKEEDFDKLRILEEEVQDNNKDAVIEKGTLCVVNTDNPNYHLSYDKGTVVEFIEFDGSILPYYFTDSNGKTQYMERKDFDILEEQEGTKKRFEFAELSKILLTEDTSLEGTKVNLTEPSIWIEDDGSLIINTDCDDGIPYIKSNKSGYGAFISLNKLEKRESDTLQDTPSFEIGEVVEVKEGKDCSGAVGYAILTDIEEREVILQGFNKDGEFFDSWHNNIDNIKKVDK